MKESYIVSDFRETAARHFPAQAERLNAALDARLRSLREENAGAGREKRRHLDSQILPGIAAYETLQTVMPKEEALRTVHGYVERRAWKLKRIFLRLMRVPGLYKKCREFSPDRRRNTSSPRPALLRRSFRSPAACGAST